jgi:hypothetical protein
MDLLWTCCPCAAQARAQSRSATAASWACCGLAVDLLWTRPRAAGCRGVGVSGCRGVGVSGCRGVGVSGCGGSTSRKGAGYATPLEVSATCLSRRLYEPQGGWLRHPLEVSATYLSRRLYEPQGAGYATPLEVSATCLSRRLYEPQGWLRHPLRS